MSTEETKIKVDTVADLIAVLEKVKDKTAKLTVSGETIGCHDCSGEQFDRQISSIEVSCR